MLLEQICCEKCKDNHFYKGVLTRQGCSKCLWLWGSNGFLPSGQVLAKVGLIHEKKKKEKKVATLSRNDACGVAAQQNPPRRRQEPELPRQQSLGASVDGGTDGQKDISLMCDTGSAPSDVSLRLLRVPPSPQPCSLCQHLLTGRRGRTCLTGASGLFIAPSSLRHVSLFTSSVWGGKNKKQNPSR